MVKYGGVPQHQSISAKTMQVSRPHSLPEGGLRISDDRFTPFAYNHLYINKTHRFRCVSARNPPFRSISKSLGNGSPGCARDPQSWPHVFSEAQMVWTNPPDPKTLHTRPVHLSQVSYSGVGLPSARRFICLPAERHSRTVGPAGTMSARRHYLPPDLQPLRPSGPRYYVPST